MRLLAELESSPRFRRAFGAAVIIVITLVAYVPAMRGGWIWDDDSYVTQNPTLTTGGGLKQIWLEPRSIPQYYPLVHTTFWIEHQLWGLNPFGYHAVNVLLHVINALLLWTILRRLSVPGAWFAACLFAVHPVHVESVAWVTERKNVLSAMFYLCAMLAYLPFCLPDEHERHEAWSWRRYVAVSALLVCALLSKTVACTFPAAVLLIAWWKRGGRITWRRDVAPLAPMFLIGLAFGLTTAWLEKVHVGAEGKDWSLSPIDRMHVAGRAGQSNLAR
jgi:protein O-mannosyl-transferase